MMRPGGRDDAPAKTRSTSRTGRNAADASQERLWAARMAEQPDIISEIVKFIEAARTQLIESPPVAPGDEESKSETASDRGERSGRN